MIDGLPAAELPQAVDMLLSQWPADAVAGELWRYVRDRAYERFDRHVEPTRGDSLDQVLTLARRADALVAPGESSERYRQMKGVAQTHLRELAERHPDQAEWLANAPAGSGSPSRAGGASGFSADSRDSTFERQEWCPHFSAIIVEPYHVCYVLATIDWLEHQCVRPAAIGTRTVAVAAGGTRPSGPLTR